MSITIPHFNYSIYDYHMHTVFSDGKHSPSEMVSAALKKYGYTSIAITDHIWETSTWFDDYYLEIRELNRAINNIKILVGFEAKALNTCGDIDASDRMCEMADIRIGAVHRIPASEEKNCYMSRDQIEENRQLAYSNWLLSTRHLIMNDSVDVVAHPCLAIVKYQLKSNEVDICELFELALRYKKKLEISKRYPLANAILLDAVNVNLLYFLALSYGSDAHSIEEL